MPPKSKPADESDYPDEPELLPSAAPVDATSTVNEINLKVQYAQEQILDLRRQQEEIERQKRELEDLSRKQREFDEGRREIVEKLTRGLVLLERQEFEVKRELEQIKIVRDNFAEHLGQIESLNPAEWSSEELSSELTKALARVDQAKSIYSQSRARLVALREIEEGPGEMPADLGPEPMTEEKSFGTMVKEGFAYSLIPALLVLFSLLLYDLLFHH
jgi:vacuolar-type H+-ATPase subunit I/STV1